MWDDATPILNTMTTEQFILEAFQKDIDTEGLFWRINRPNTFIDLLMLEAYKASNQGLDMSIALKVVITSLKALINDKYGILDYRLDFEELNRQILIEKDSIHIDIKELIQKQLNNGNQLPNNHFDDLNYIKVLSNLRIEDYSTLVFENILQSFLIYIKSNK